MADTLKGGKALLIILDTIRTVLRQNLPPRGHMHSESSFDQLTQLLSRQQDDIRWWLERKHRTNSTSSDVIKEMSALVGVSTMRLISTHLRGRKFAFMIDETPDLQGVEQTALVVRKSQVINAVQEEQHLLEEHATSINAVILLEMVAGIDRKYDIADLKKCSIFGW